jgi:hypothetical protein
LQILEGSYFIPSKWWTRLDPMQEHGHLPSHILLNEKEKKYTGIRKSGW